MMLDAPATPPGWRLAPPRTAPAVDAPRSRDDLVERYAHLVKYVVGRLGVSLTGVFDRDDAIQVGTIGLLRAADSFRPEMAASFESYAIVRIRGAILDAVRALDAAGRTGREAARAIAGAIRDLEVELERVPREEEIAGRLGLSLERYRERLQVASVVVVPIDEGHARDDDDEGIGLGERIADPSAPDPSDALARQDAIARLSREIGRLSERQQLVLSLYYQDELTLREIGEVLGVTESRVSQIHTETVLLLRKRLVDPALAARLGTRKVRA